MNFTELVEKNRSYRRFDASYEVSIGTLRELVDLARKTATGANKQPLKYMLSCGPEANARIFETLAWAGALKEWDGPAESERPSAYIVILVDKEIRPSGGKDVGIAAQTILLGAAERGLGGCMLGSIKRPVLQTALSIPEELEISLVIALGKPAEKVVLEDAAPGASIDYYRDADDVHHVPKRTLTEILVGQFEE